MTKTKTKCAIADCQNPILARGWCETHYYHWRRYGDPNIGERRCPRHWSLAQRLAYYSAPPNERGCTLWLSEKNAFGYGIITYNSKQMKVHRATWELVNGPIPDGLHVLHSCDVPACRTVGHLFLGTNDDNVADKVAKGRQSRLLGEAHGRAKLTAEQVIAIRSDMRAKRTIADDYGVSDAVVINIQKRKIWKHI